MIKLFFMLRQSLTQYGDFKLVMEYDRVRVAYSLPESVLSRNDKGELWGINVPFMPLDSWLALPFKYVGGERFARFEKEVADTPVNRAYLAMVLGEFPATTTIEDAGEYLSALR